MFQKNYRNCRREVLLLLLYAAVRVPLRREQGVVDIVLVDQLVQQVNIAV